MPRIRTLKPDFFLSDDICALSMGARLLYQGLWQHADREGRLEWKPGALKRAILPTDDVDIHALFGELADRGLVVPYGDGLAWIPTFLEHQRINAREPASVLPPPPHMQAHARTCGREGEGTEEKGEERKGGGGAPAARPLPGDWIPGEEDTIWAAGARPDLTPAMLDEQTVRFRNHALSRDRRLADWGPAWRNWIGEARRAAPAIVPRAASAAAGVSSTVAHDTDDQWRARLRGYRPDRFWHGDWGPRPESGRSVVPPDILADWTAAQCREEPHAHASSSPAHTGTD